MKKALCITTLLGVITVAVFCWYKYKTQASTKITTALHINAPASTPAVQDNAPVKKQRNVLNLALPQTPLLVDPIIKLPDSPHDLRNIFVREEKEAAVKVGGHLILEEKPPEPNAAVWDQVKGAEVGITIKTP